jgi:hypothetical protein
MVPHSPNGQRLHAIGAGNTAHVGPEFRLQLVGDQGAPFVSGKDAMHQDAGVGHKATFYRFSRPCGTLLHIQSFHMAAMDRMSLRPRTGKYKGRPGHYGLPGMRERTKLIGGSLELWSKAQAGTEIELTIPAAAAYAKPDGQRGSKFFRKGAGAN